VATTLIAFIALTAVVTPSALAREGVAVGGTAVVSDTEGYGAKLRSGPGMSYKVVATMPDGTRVQVLAGPVSDGNDDWWQVTLVGSSTGWVVDRYLAPASSKESSAPSGDGSGRQFLAKTTAYADGVGGVPLNARTASGTRTRWGVVAVDPKIVPMGSSLRIEGFDNTFTAEDTGGGIKGNAVDIWFPDGDQAKVYGMQNRKVTVLREGPAKP
jgi:3D (Asp-Asp-Asp) domain-containing protein